MRGFKRAAAILLPVLTASLALPAEHVNSPLHQDRSEKPGSQIPYIYTYDAQDGASIQFTLEPASQDTRLDEPEPEVISIVVPPSDERACSDDSNTHIQVNGETLVATHKNAIEGNTVQRSGSSISLSNFASESVEEAYTSSTWNLTCTCLDEVSSLLSVAGNNCGTIGYRLDFQLSASSDANLEGFTLSFTQSPRPKLLRLTSLVFSALEATVVSVNDLRNSRHWLAPPLQPIDTIFGNIPTSTFSQTLPVFSSTISHSFRTVLTPDASSTRHPSKASALSTRQAPVPATPTLISARVASATAVVDTDSLDSFSRSSSKADSSVIEVEEPVIIQALQDSEAQVSVHATQCCSLKQVKQTLFNARLRAQATLQSVLGHITQTHLEDQEIKQTSFDHNRNETRDFQETQQNDSSSIFPATETSYKYTALAACIIVFTSVSGTIFACIRLRDPRRQAERAALREERINRRLYRKAARKQKFRDFFDRLCGRETYRTQSQNFAQAQIHTRHPSGELDLEWHEKFEGESISHDQHVATAHTAQNVRKEIGDLREAYGFVEGLLRATSGMYRGSRNAKRDHSRGSRNRRRYSDADSEKSFLPPYTSEDEYEEVIVVDGLHFTATRRRRYTPASSVIETSPHESDCGSSVSGKEV